MKTIFSSFGFTFLLVSVFLGSINVHAQESKMGNLMDQSTINFSDDGNDYPYSYAARIKRFHRPYKGMDYFAPAYVDLNNYTSILTLGLTIYSETPFNNNLKEWSKNNGSVAIYKYYHDEFYRKRVDMWNRIFNPNWQYYKSSFNPIGGFNYNYGFGLAGNPNSLYHCSALSNFYAYESTLDEYLNAVLYGQTAFSHGGKFTESTSPEILKPTPPVPTTPFITKKVKVNQPIVSTIQKTSLQKEDFMDMWRLQQRRDYLKIGEPYREH